MSEKRDFDDLFTGYLGRGGWKNAISDEGREWLSDLADYIIEQDREPTWRAAYTLFGKKYPQDLPKSPTTLRDAVRQMVEEKHE